MGKLDCPLMDDVHVFTYRGFRPPYRAVDPPAARGCLARYRQTLRRAQRFVIDDDMVRLTCQLSHARSRHSAWSVLARLPYDAVWMEFNLHVKVKEFERLGRLADGPFDPTQVSERVGYLMQRDLDTSSRWIATEFVVYEGEVLTQPNVFVFDPEGSPLRPVTGSTLLGRTSYSAAGGPPVTLNVETNAGVYASASMEPEFLAVGSFGYDHETKSPVPPAWAQYKVGCVIDPLWRALCGSNAAALRRLNQISLEDMRERMGVLRWLMCLLATINDAPTTLRAVRGREATRQAGAHLLKFLDHTVVTVAAPKTRQLQFVQRKLDGAAAQAHRARHAVRGHWRVIEYGQRLPFLCRHEPLVVENGVGLCERCERKIRWIEDHERGDAALGYVQHGYRVKANT